MGIRNTSITQRVQQFFDNVSYRATNQNNVAKFQPRVQKQASGGKLRSHELESKEIYCCIKATD